MKNALKYYYNLDISNIHQINGTYKFNIKNEYYTLIEIDKDLKHIENIYNLSIYLNQKGIYTNQIVLNNQKNIITFINQTNYILIKSFDNLDRIININDIINFNNATIGIDNYIRRDNWYNLWINKLDYFEYQIKELENKYPLLKKSFNYFAGLTETGIELLINMNIKQDKQCVCHDRIKKNTTLFDLYNPFNFIIDSNVRDIVEYFKELFIYNDPYPLIEEYIKYNNLTHNELKLFFIRMLYPSFYFDLYENIIENKVSELEINKIINKVDEYEILIKKTYILIKNICPLPEIDWLIK